LKRNQKNEADNGKQRTFPVFVELFTIKDSTKIYR
jgi:hypothetical protein